MITLLQADALGRPHLLKQLLTWVLKKMMRFLMIMLRILRMRNQNKSRLLLKTILLLITNLLQRKQRLLKRNQTLLKNPKYLKRLDLLNLWISLMKLNLQEKLLQSSKINKNKWTETWTNQEKKTEIFTILQRSKKQLRKGQSAMLPRLSSQNQGKLPSQIYHKGQSQKWIKTNFQPFPKRMKNWSTNS